LNRFEVDFRLGFAFGTPTPGVFRMNVIPWELQEKQFVSV